uniref:Serine/threonine-protein phosphatase n=1 Tax=Culicoides sonorensis TaxID=179676 RepID=A0A336LZL2_CULSO
MSIKQLPNVVSLVIKNQDQNSFLFNVNGNYITLPYIHLHENRSWTETSNDFAKQIFSIIPSNMDICQIYRIYHPTQNFITNVIYEVKLSDDFLSKCIIQLILNGMQLQWMSHFDAIENNLISKKYWKTLIDAKSESFLTEITQNDVLLTSKNTDPSNFEMLSIANITENDQKNLYKDFLKITWPENVMTLDDFKIFCDEIFNGKEDKNFIELLFNAGDVQNGKCLSFRDVILVLAAADPNTPHNGIGHKNYWDNADLKAVVLEIWQKCGKKLDGLELETEVENLKSELLLIPGPKVRLEDILSATDQLRFRESASLLRLKTKFKSRQLSFLDQSLKFITSSKQLIPKSQNEIFSSPEIALHTLKFRYMGSMIDVDEVWTMEKFVSASSIKSLKILKSRQQSSIMIFQGNSEVTEVLQYLKYFTQDVIEEKKGVTKEAYSWGEKNLSKFGNLMISICQKLTNKMKDDPRCLAIKSPLYVMGDLHGNYPDLIGFERILWHLSPTLTPCKLLFLGDYVDRGVNSVEVVAYLFAYKFHNYEKLHLIRGNHEIRDTQRTFTFYAECTQKFGSKLGDKVWTAINNVFDVMPLAAVIDNKIFACHGGIPPPWLLQGSIEMLNNIACPLPSPKDQNQLAWCLMWNDPVKENNSNEELQKELEQNNGFGFNVRRGTGYVFSEDALNEFLEKHNLSHVIRAHQAQQHGVSIQFSGKLISVFSSSQYCSMKNDAGCLAIESNKIRLLRFDVETFGKANSAN